MQGSFIDDFARGRIDAVPTHVIMNPPYRKIRTSSPEYAALSGVGLQTTNMYSAFIAISHSLLKDGGRPDPENRQSPDGLICGILRISPGAP